jgi:hypothetical protein
MARGQWGATGGRLRIYGMGWVRSKSQAGGQQTGVEASAIVGYSPAAALREEGRLALRHAACRANEQASTAPGGS